MSNVIVAENLWFKYIGSSDWVLKDITFSVREGETIVIMGPSGCGKSTLMYILMGMAPHVIRGELRGYVEILGRDISRSRPEDLVRDIGLVFQNPEIQIIMPSVIEELVFGLENFGVDALEIDRRVNEVLEFTGLRNKMYSSVHELSLGEKQVLAIASVLALRPKILILDEPTSMLDHIGTKRILKLIEKIKNETKMTLVIVEHRIEWIAEHADRVIVMDDGRIVASGSPSEVFGNKDLVMRIGIRPPQVSEIFYYLHDKIPQYIREIPVTLDSAISILRNAIRYRGSIAKDYGQYMMKMGVGLNRNRVVEIRDLWFRYGKDLPWVLRGLNLDVYEGEFLAIIGHSGAGKTTLIKHINGLLKPVKGYVRVLGYNTHKVPVSILARYVGIVFQNPEAQFFASTIYDEMSFALRKLKFSRDEIEKRVRESLKAVDLYKPLDMSPHLLSFGEKHRLAIASILALKPKIIILDEPFSGLDYKRSLQLLLVLKEFTKQGGTVILVAHDLQLISEVADRIVVLSNGVIIREGTPIEILSDVDWLEKHGFTPLQSTLLARELGLKGLIKTYDVAEVLAKLLGGET